MGRELRRVSMDFNYPLHTIWYGHLFDFINTCLSIKGKRDYCESCKAAAKIKGVQMHEWGCPDWEAYIEEPAKKLKELLAPPTGDGYQLWETTSEGSPVSPVFATLDELCEWCEEGATVSGNIKATKEQWKEMLTRFDDGTVIYEDKMNGVLFI